MVENIHICYKIDKQYGNKLNDAETIWPLFLAPF